MKWLNPIKTYWELEPFKHFLSDPSKFIVTYFAGWLFFGVVVGMWTMDIFFFLTFAYVLIEFTKQILRWKVEEFIEIYLPKSRQFLKHPQRTWFCFQFAFTRTDSARDH